MKNGFVASFVLAALFGCSSASSRRATPFRHASVVAEWNLGALRDSVQKQEDLKLHPPEPEIVTLKRYPNPKELKSLEMAFLPGDKFVEFKNDDWWADFDAGSNEAERAFCVVRLGHVVRSVLIWSADE